MSKFARKYNFNAKGILYIEDEIMYIENSENGQLISISEHLKDFVGKECTIAVAYAEDVE